MCVHSGMLARAQAWARVLFFFFLFFCGTADFKGCLRRQDEINQKRRTVMVRGLRRACRSREECVFLLSLAGFFFFSLSVHFKQR